MANNESTDVIREKVDSFEYKPQISSFGHVLKVGDGIFWADGLEGLQLSELVELPGEIYGMALSLAENYNGIALLNGEYEVTEGMEVRGTGHVVQVPVQGLEGRIVDPIGRPLDAQGPIQSLKFRPVEREAPAIIDRDAVERPLQTGWLAIDAMVPIGKGQRELIIGDRQTGKTALAVDTIINQRGRNVRCFYVAIGQKISTVKNVMEELAHHDALSYTTVVFAGASDPAPMQYLAPYAGCAMAEHVMEEGGDALIVYDDLSKHAVAYRSMSLLLRRPPGREAYPGDVFYLHSRLLERAAQLSAKKGGGSITALPIVETMAGDISAYIPTNVISITHGRIFLEESLFHSGIRPALNVGLSVSRVGGAAQTPAVRKSAGQLRLDLSQYREMKVFSQFGSDLDESTRDLLSYGERLTQVLIQDRYTPIPEDEQAVILYAMTQRGLVSSLEQTKWVQESLIAFIQQSYPQILAQLGKDHTLNDDVRAWIADAVKDFITQKTEQKQKEELAKAKAAAVVQENEQ